MNLMKKREHPDAMHDRMNWVTPETAQRASLRRETLVRAILDSPASGSGWRFNETKLYTHGISPGCDLCGKGEWSCLFINGICNARCFYCPSSQKEKGQPMTSSVIFSNPADYAAYINTFKIKGISFSGGEPFMSFDRVLIFLKTLRDRVAHPLYIWMYTNGILVTQTHLKQLRDAGLSEIRFDISANHYCLDALKKAVGIVPCVTVEIPAIPEDMDITRTVVKELYHAGVDYLNLHQLRCTAFNLPKFIQRGYTFLPGPDVTVLETELAALELIRYALDEKILLPINYCSFTFRHQFQGAGARKRAGMIIKSDREDITATGHIRTLSVCGPPARISSVESQLLSAAVNPELWQVAARKDQLFFAAALWPQIHFSGLQLKVSYSTCGLKSAISYQHAFREVVLSRKKKVIVERRALPSGICLEGEQIHWFAKQFLVPASLPSGRTGSEEYTDSSLFSDIRQYERISPGLAPYHPDVS